MKSYIKAIIIFNENNEKRIVPLEEGVNIITGESKTGKSALVEIIDYCLCSTRCTIPKGVITDFSYLYSLVMVIDDNFYVIARYSWNKGGKMLFLKESKNFDYNSLDLSYFADKTPLPYKNVQYEIECALGLLVTNMTQDIDKKSKKASLRNMVSYLFQHQNLMASKFALFYRFSDYYKRKDVIDQFPVFAGLIGQEYYSQLIELNTYKTKLKQLQKKKEANNKSISYIRNNLSPLLSDYFALLNKQFDDNISLQEMFKIASNLPNYDETQLFGESQIAERYNELKIKLEKLRDEEREILIKIKNVENISRAGDDFSKILKDLKQQTSVSQIETDEYICPLCGQKYDDIANDDAELIEATEWLDNELIITEKYTTDFSEDERKLKEAKENIEDKIKQLWPQIKNIEKKYLVSKNLQSKAEKINYAKAKISLFVEMNNSGIFDSVDKDIEELKNKIEECGAEINKFDIKRKINRAQSFISNNMNELSKNLNFEEEYRPVKLNFGLADESFDLYQLQNNKEKIQLYEMGSGANWVSCHIALFLSLLRYFATQKNSPMLLTMFFDQPSQVYFPQGEYEDTFMQEDLTNSEKLQKQADLEAVDMMYKTIFDEVNSIKDDTNIFPQLIIVDHVDGSNLKCEKEFKKYIRCTWRNGKALI